MASLDKTLPGKYGPCTGALMALQEATVPDPLLKLPTHESFPGTGARIPASKWSPLTPTIGYNRASVPILAACSTRVVGQ